MRVTPLAALILGLAIIPAPAFAYIDPNAGGLLFQILTPLLAVLGAGLVFAREQVNRFFDFVRTTLIWWRK